MEVGGRCGGVCVGVGRLLTAHIVVHVGWGWQKYFSIFKNVCLELKFYVSFSMFVMSACSAHPQILMRGLAHPSPRDLNNLKDFDIYISAAEVFGVEK